MTDVEAALLRIQARFLAEGGQRAALLRDALACGDYAKIKDVAHKVCGLAGTIGLPDLSKLAQRIEDLIDSCTDPDSLAQATCVLAQELERGAASRAGDSTQ